MRVEAQRNAETLRAAAAELFQERVPQAPLKEIALRAGASHGTLFPSALAARSVTGRLFPRRRGSAWHD